MSPIPRNIWQTSRSDSVPDPAREMMRTWREMNPGWTHHFFDDEAIYRFIEENFEAPVLEVFLSLPLGVMRADLWRYLVLLKRGGCYTDLDTTCLEPIDRWLPNDCELFLAHETEENFCQWTIIARPGHPILERVVEELIESNRFRRIDMAFEHFVHFSTGPELFTRAILAWLKEQDLEDEPDLKNSRKLRERGIYIKSLEFFRREKVQHHFGSTNWAEDYESWTEARRRIVRQSWQNQENS